MNEDEFLFTIKTFLHGTELTTQSWIAVITFLQKFKSLLPDPKQIERIQYMDFLDFSDEEEPSELETLIHKANKANAHIIILCNLPKHYYLVIDVSYDFYNTETLLVLPEQELVKIPKNKLIYV